MDHVRAARRARPGAAVLAAFGLEGEPVPLNGGQGRSWRVGPAVLKPLDMPLRALRWQAGVLRRLDHREDVRVSVPLRTASGALARQGWTAWRYEPGEPGRWQDVVEVGRRLHAALRDEPEPALLAPRTDVWAVADRVAWGEVPAGDDGARTRHLQRLVDARQPVHDRCQLVHGDLTGNVLFHARLPPLVIDLSPYWRPAAYAGAVVVADALVSEGAGPDVVQPMLVDVDPQHLLRALVFRALVFRAVADHLARRGLPDDDRYGAAVDVAVDLARRRR